MLEETAVNESEGTDVATKRDVKATDVYQLLKKRYDDERQWLCAGEVSNTTGGGLRRLDFVAVNCYESQGYGIHAFEIKISKSDLRRELEDPSKHNIFFEFIDTYSIVAPDYVLDAEYKKLIPPKWGIYTVSTRAVKDNVSGEVTDERYIKVVRKPLNLHDDKDLTMKRSFAMSLLRAIRNQNAEKFYVEELLRKEYKRGREEGENYCGWELKDLRRKYEEEAWKFKFLDRLHIYTKDRAEKCIPKIKAMLSLYDQMDWLADRIRSVETSLSQMKELNDAFKKFLNGEELSTDEEKSLMERMF